MNDETDWQQWMDKLSYAEKELYDGWHKTIELEEISDERDG